MACLRGLADVPRHLDAIGVPDPGGTNLIRATLDRIAPEYDVTPIARAIDLSRIAIYIAPTADRSPAFPTLRRIARARTEAPVHGVSPATARMPRIVHAIRPRSRHRRPAPRGSPRQDSEPPRTLPLERTPEGSREPYGALCAHRRPLDLDQVDAATARRVGAAIPAPGKPSPSPARTVPAFKAGKTLCGRLDGQHGEPAVRWHPFGREPLPGRPRSFATHPPQREATNSPLPSRILRHRRPGRSHAHCAPAITLPPPSSGCLLPPGRPVSMTFVAERRCQELPDSPQVRMPAQASRRHRIPRTRMLYMPGCEFLTETVMRALALRSKWVRCRAAYGAGKCSSERLAHSSTQNFWVYDARKVRCQFYSEDIVLAP